MTRGALGRNRNFVLLWTGGAFAIMGARASAIAFPLLVLATGGTASEAGLVGFAAMLPYLLFQLLAGALVDRLNRRLVLITADLGRSIVIGSVVLAVLLSAASVAYLMAAAFLEGILAVFRSLAERAAIRHVVPDRHLTAAMSRNEAAIRAAALAGQPLGGLLFAVHHSMPFVFDVLTCFVSAGTVALVRGQFRVPSGQSTGTQRRLLAEIGEGLSWIWRRPFMRVTAIALAASNLLFQALFLAMIVMITHQGASSIVVGLVLAGAGIGGVLGAMSAPWFARRLSTRTIFVGANWVWVALIPLLAFVTFPPAAGAIFAAIAFVGPLWNVAISAYQMQLTPEHMQGRVASAIGTLSYGSIPLGSLLAGFLLDRYSGSVAMSVLGVLMAFIALFVHLSPATRRLSPLSATDGGAA